MIKTSALILVGATLLSIGPISRAGGELPREILLDVDSPRQLTLPPVSTGPPAAGKRVRATSPEYAGTRVYHSLYLPEHWDRGWRQTGARLPIIFEYTGNWFPKAGSTGQVKDAGLGYGLSGGKYIWVVLPYIREDGRSNEITWWGDINKTIEYAKTNVPWIIEQFGGDRRAVFLCGFSRGAIGVNYIGLHDDEIAGLWSAFITHDHFDGVREWRGTDWGAPLADYRKAAAERLKRVHGRPYLVIQNGRGYGSDAFVRSVLPAIDNFTFSYISTKDIFGTFPNELAKAPHTDRWLLKPSPYRKATWTWMNSVTQELLDAKDR